MDSSERNRVYRRGVALCRKGMLTDAALLFRELIEGGSEDPLHLSFCGLLTVTVHGRRAEGLELCRRAAQFGADEPDVVLNLARLYEMTGERTKALKLLRRGLRENPKHPRLLDRINRLSPRRTPPLSMVDRNNPINKQLAILLAKLGGRNASPDDRAKHVRDSSRVTCTS